MILLYIIVIIDEILFQWTSMNLAAMTVLLLWILLIHISILTLRKKITVFCPPPTSEFVVIMRIFVPRWGLILLPQPSPPQVFFHLPYRNLPHCKFIFNVVNICSSPEFLKAGVDYFKVIGIHKFSGSTIVTFNAAKHSKYLNFA